MTVNEPRMDPTGIFPDGDEGDVAQIIDGVVTFGPLVVPVTAAPMVSIDENGNPGLIFDENGNIYRTEEG